ncbi:MAG: DNA-binding protein [Actinomycetaceae bacterium]|nr:DNA-binding protein [Actinomycetaceae bacterium]
MPEFFPTQLSEATPTPISQLKSRERAVVRGRLVAMTYPAQAAAPKLRAHMKDDTGTLIIDWPGRREIPGLGVGAEIVVEGTVSLQQSDLIMSNPTYLIVAGDE